jgi:hypothetical protein
MTPEMVSKAVQPSGSSVLKKTENRLVTIAILNPHMLEFYFPLSGGYSEDRRCTWRNPM